MIIVTGANGPLGRQVVEHLVRLVPADQVVACVREPAKSGLDVEVRQGDFGHPATLDFTGADTLFLNATNYGSPPEVRARQQANAIDAARAAGVRRIVQTSWPEADRCPIEFMSDYPATERLVAREFAHRTVLRIGYGMAAALARDVITARKAGVLVAPAGDARVTASTTSDQAEAAARVLAEAEGHDGKIYEFTGPDTVSWTDLAALAGPGIAYRAAGEDEFRERSTGFPPAVVAQLIALYAAFRAGWAGTPTPDLAGLLGRPPTGTLDAVADAVESWAW